MKRLILLILIGSFMLLTFVGCLPNDKSEETTPSNATDGTTSNIVFDETTTPGDTGTLTPPQKELSFEDVFNRGNITFVAQLFIQDASLETTQTEIDVEVLEGGIRVDGVLCTTVEITQDPIFVSPQKIFSNTNKSSDEVLEILVKLQNSEVCYTLRNESDDADTKKIVVYDIDDTFYILNFYDENRVTSIYCADKNVFQSSGVELDPKSDLARVLSDFWELYGLPVGFYDKLTLPEQITAIKNGCQALHIFFDPFNYYYVCGYYNPEHSYEEIQCCAQKYRWVIYQNVNEIQKYYGNEKCRVAFQMNKAVSITDIIFNEAETPDIEHFQLYTPVFENGRNVAAPIFFDQNFIYLNVYYHGKEVIYHSQSQRNHSVVTLPIVFLADQYYLFVHLNTTKTGETFNAQEVLSTKAIISKFGDYYDDLMKVIDAEKYSVVEENGNTVHYGVVLLEDLVNDVIKSGKDNNDKN